MALKTVFVILSVLCFIQAADLGKTAILKKITTILNHIPESEKNDFLRYHLNKGRELMLAQLSDNYPDFDYDLDEDDSILLYKYFATNNLVTDEEVVKKVSNIICWGNKCIDFSDPGVHP
ncbi:uncharacterized protein LOC103312227 [Tribolium castaneum]|nr:PREDICTED: uncharacterized protein LOC103312227 [Tribolium castaneum]|eukprot:XP_008190585.1 PREDICTED: uncharacterized protein LOC103312227 [Tribolium castaneum]